VLLILKIGRFNLGQPLFQQHLQQLRVGLKKKMSSADTPNLGAGIEKSKVSDGLLKDL